MHHALLEVYRRRKNQKGRPTEDLLPKLRNRIIAAFEASGLTREAYTELVVGRDDAPTPSRRSFCRMGRPQRKA